MKYLDIIINLIDLSGIFQGMGNGSPVIIPLVFLVIITFLIMHLTKKPSNVNLYDTDNSINEEKNYWGREDENGWYFICDKKVYHIKDCIFIWGTGWLGRTVMKREDMEIYREYYDGKFHNSTQEMFLHEKYNEFICINFLSEGKKPKVIYIGSAEDPDSIENWLRESGADKSAYARAGIELECDL